tara:strand:- start:2110 stop:2796 length:687 start_codon:yes stop_codon:yes gene_type:complete
MSKLLIKFPSRNRPDKFKKVLRKYIDFLSGNHDVRFVISMDEDDKKMNTKDIKTFLKRLRKGGVDLVYHYGNSKSKVEACNANMENENADVIMLISDDMIPQLRNYDDVIFEYFSKAFPDFDGGIKFHDGLRNDILMTLPIIGWKVYEKWGYIYHPDYTSLYCDTEQTFALQIMGKLAAVDICLAKHEWTPEPFDELHARNENAQMYHKDGAVFQRRKMNNFDVGVLS